MKAQKGLDAAAGRMAIGLPLILNVAFGEVGRRSIGSCFMPSIPGAFLWASGAVAAISLVAIGRTFWMGRFGAAAVGAAVLASALFLPIYAIAEICQSFFRIM